MFSQYSPLMHIIALHSLPELITSVYLHAF